MGVALAQARAEAGLSLAQLSDRTMIRPGLIEAIEADDYHACGGDFYARGHVKSLAQALGIDPAPLLAEFDRAHAPDPDTVAPTAAGVLDVAVVSAAGARAERAKPNWTVAMVVALALVLAFGGYRALSGGGGSPTDTVAGGAVTASADVTDSPAADQDGSGDQTDGTGSDSSGDGSATEPSQAPTDAIAALPGDATGEVTVVLEAVGGRSWISATGKESGQLYQGVLDVGKTRDLRDDQQVKLVVGNAGAVRLVVNGRDLGSPGAQGEVVRLTFGPGDPTATGG